MMVDSEDTVDDDDEWQIFGLTDFDFNEPNPVVDEALCGVLDGGGGRGC